ANIRSLMVTSLLGIGRGSDPVSAVSREGGSLETDFTLKCLELYQGSHCNDCITQPHRILVLVSISHVLFEDMRLHLDSIQLFHL
ncbi:hypothetical protein Taro_019364, partial [Colocasia esculenta]|nr:hypothetical protein [Colocasia esculenta]